MNKTPLLLAAALTGLAMTTLTGCPMPEAKAAGQCHGVNTCKGSGACGGKNHDCAGKNACKGQGWLKIDKETCQAQGGNYVESKE